MKHISDISIEICIYQHPDEGYCYDIRNPDTGEVISRSGYFKKLIDLNYHLKEKGLR